MEPKDFLGFIQRGLKDYNRDKWIFLRELAQNSRDAQASKILIKASIEKDQEIISFQDNGTGISFLEAKKFLFKLFASNKIEDEQSAGKFGIGFWSIIRYNPKSIIIESFKMKNENWALIIDQGFKQRQIKSSLSTPGTRIILKRPAFFDNEKDFIETVRNASVKYCQYLRKKSRIIKELPTFFNSQKISKKTINPSIPFETSFKNKSYEGYVGISDHPMVKIFSKGLLVWEGVSIAEFFTHQKTKLPHNIEGISPVIVINSNKLKVDISRKKLLENNTLKKLLQITQKELQNLIKFNSENPTGVKFLRKTGNFINNFFYLVRKNFLLSLMLIVIGLILGSFLVISLSPVKQPKSILSGFSEIKAYNATVADGITSQKQFSITSTGIKDAKLSMFVADNYDQQKGFLRRKTKQQIIPVLTKKRSISFKITGLNIDTNLHTKFYLPHPANFSPIITNFRINQKTTFPDLQSFKSNEVFLNLKPNPKLKSISYICDMNSSRFITSKEFNYYIYIPPGITISNNFSKISEDIIDLNNDKKIKILSDFTTKFLTYDSSESTVLEFQNLQASDWLEKIKTIKKGDCDIINGFLTLILRKAKIPSRLAIGYVLKNGKSTSSILHAWCEYFKQGVGWQNIDLTQSPDLQIGKTSNIATNLPPQNLKTGDLSIQSTPFFQKNHTYFLLSISFFLLLILFFTSKMYTLKKKKKYIKKYNTLKIIADLCITSLKTPSLWGYNNQFWELCIIPAINKKNLSLKELVRNSSKNNLILTDLNILQNPLLQNVRSEFSILSSKDPNFHKLFNIIPANKELDRLHNYIQEYCKNFEKLYSDLLFKIETTILKIFKQKIKLLITGEKNIEKIHFFNFHQILKTNKLGRKFIIINSNSEIFKQKFLDYATNRYPDTLVEFEIIKKILNSSHSSIIFPLPNDHNNKILAAYILRQILKDNLNDT